MADLQQALSWLDQGFKVRFYSWQAGDYLFCERDISDKICRTNGSKDYRKSSFFDIFDFLAYGSLWELVDPQDDPEYTNVSYEQQMFELGQKVMESLRFHRKE